MTIKKGELWGEPGPLANDGLVVASDAEARRELEAAAADGRAIRELGLTGGDLARTLGARDGASRLGTDASMRLPIDAVQVFLDDEEHWFAAHLVARRPLWQGDFTVIMNAEYLGEWRMAPASHPNDGRVDVITGRLSLGDRFKARSRLTAGMHLPHPDISVRRLRKVDLVLDGRVPVALDGEMVGRPRNVRVIVHPDAVIGVV